MMQAQMSLNILRYFVAIMTFISEFLCFRAFFCKEFHFTKQAINYVRTDKYGPN